MLIITEISHLTRIASSPDEEFDYENSNLNMGDLDPDCNLLATSNTALTTKYYLESDINEITKCNDNYVRGLSLMHLNIRSIPKSIDKLSNYLTLLDLQFSIIALSETWLNNETSEIYELPEYRCIHLTRPSKRGGGVSMYIHRSYDYVERPDINIMTVHLECMFVEMKSQFKKHKENIGWCSLQTTKGNEIKHSIKML